MVFWRSLHRGQSQRPRRARCRSHRPPSHHQRSGVLVVQPLEAALPACTSMAHLNKFISPWPVSSRHVRKIWKGYWTRPGKVLEWNLWRLADGTLHSWQQQVVPPQRLWNLVLLNTAISSQKHDMFWQTGRKREWTLQITSWKGESAIYGDS